MTALVGPLYVVTAVLGLAGLAKIGRPAATATALREIGIPQSVFVARLLGFVEILVAALAIATGTAQLWTAVAVIYTAFTMYILWALGRGAAVGSCGCFGREDTPPSPLHAAYNAAAATIAGLAAADPIALGEIDMSLTESILLASLVAIGTVLSVVALTHLPRVLALSNGTAPTAAPTFSVARGDRRRG